jgi:hypothetical protein
MSIDLTLLPLNCDNPRSSYSHTVLPLQTNTRDLFEEIERILDVKNNAFHFITDEQMSGEVDFQFTSYLARNEDGDSHYGEIENDCYGAKLKWVRASVLQGLTHHDGVQRNPLNKQAWGYINACPASTKIVLYWS